MTVVNYGYPTGRTLTLTARQPDGTLRGTINQAMTEIQTELYNVNTDVDLVALDTVIIKDSVSGVVAQGEYQPEVTSPALTVGLAAIDTKVDTVDTNVDSLILASGKILITNQPVESKDVEKIVVLRNL